MMTYSLQQVLNAFSPSNDPSSEDWMKNVCQPPTLYIILTILPFSQECLNFLMVTFAKKIFFYVIILLMTKKLRYGKCIHMKKKKKQAEKCNFFD